MPQCKVMIFKIRKVYAIILSYLFRLVYLTLKNLCPFRKVPVSKHVSPSSRCFSHLRVNFKGDLINLEEYVFKNLCVCMYVFL